MQHEAGQSLMNAPPALTPPSSHLHQAHVCHDAPAGDTGLAALIQHPGYAAQNTQHCKQERPGQGDLRSEKREDD